MKKFLQGLWKFVNSKIFGYIMILVFAILFLGKCSSNTKLKDEADRKDQNISAMNDSIKIIVKEKGVVEFQRDGYIATAKELEEYNKELAKAVKAQKGKVITLNRMVARLKLDSTELAALVDSLKTVLEEPIQLNDSTWRIPWTAAYKKVGSVSGSSLVGVRGPEPWLKDIALTNKGITLTDWDIPINLTWGQKWVREDGEKKLKVFAETDYPGFDAKLLEGTYVDYPKKQHWLTGFGVGPTMNIGYDFLNNKPAFVVGIGIHYNIYQF